MTVEQETSTTDRDHTDLAGPRTAVLVHGAFADASGFAGVIRELESDGFTVVAPSNPLRGLSIDADHIRNVAAAIDGPVVLVGHSYGGAVIAEAAEGLANVAGLVFLAAFALERGESCLGVQDAFPPPLLAKTVGPTAYDAVGAAEGPDLAIDQSRFRETFCADVPVDTARVMAVTQRAVARAALTEPATSFGWRHLPSWYLVAEADNAINPDCQRFMAQRCGATTSSIDGSHVPFVAQPVAVATFIRSALEATQPAAP